MLLHIFIWLGTFGWLLSDSASYVLAGTDLVEAFVRAKKFSEDQEISITLPWESNSVERHTVLLKFTTKAENPSDPKGTKCALLSTYVMVDNEQYPLLRIPIMTPDEVPASYFACYDAASHTFAFCFYTRRTGCVVYEVKVPEWKKPLMPSIVESFSDELDSSQNNRLPTVRTKVVFRDYEKYANHSGKIQKLTPTRFFCDGKEWILYIALPPKGESK